MSRRSWLAVVIVLSASFADAEDWPGWRGPRGDGHSAETNAPIKWSAKSLVWKTKLPGAGQSSPVVWGDRIFLTTALSAGGSRVVMGLDRKTGDILWQQTAWTGSPEASHKMNGWASASCATDGEQVVAFFGTGGLHCYSLEGTHRWSRDLGKFPGAWGTSACPIIAGDLIVQNCDSTKGSRIMAFDKKSGQIGRAHV